MTGTLTQTRARLRQLLTRAAARGVPAWRLLLLELPRVFMTRGYARLTALLYQGVDRLRWEDRRTRVFLAPVVCKT